MAVNRQMILYACIDMHWPSIVDVGVAAELLLGRHGTTLFRRLPWAKKHKSLVIVLWQIVERYGGDGATPIECVSALQTRAFTYPQ